MTVVFDSTDIEHYHLSQKVPMRHWVYSQMVTIVEFRFILRRKIICKYCVLLWEVILKTKNRGYREGHKIVRKGLNEKLTSIAEIWKKGRASKEQQITGPIAFSYIEGNEKGRHCALYIGLEGYCGPFSFWMKFRINEGGLNRNVTCSGTQFWRIVLAVGLTVGYSDTI